MTIKYRVRTRPGDLGEFITTLPLRTRGIATVAAAEYLLGNDQRGLRHMVKYRYITRKKAYGKTFVSDKQRRYVMARIRSGKITPGRSNRSGTISRAWRLKGKGAKTTIVNDAKGADFVLGDRRQARQPALVGHHKITAVIKSNAKGSIQAADRGVQKYIMSKEK